MHLIFFIQYVNLRENGNFLVRILLQDQCPLDRAAHIPNRLSRYRCYIRYIIIFFNSTILLFLSIVAVEYVHVIFKHDSKHAIFGRR